MEVGSVLFLKAADGFELQAPYIVRHIRFELFSQDLTKCVKLAIHMFGDYGHQVVHKPTHHTSCSMLPKAAPDKCCKVPVHGKI